MQSVNEVLCCNNISKYFKEIKVLDEINIKLEQGHIYGLVGNNGAGKTTLMRIIMGLAFPTSGDISLFGDTDINSIIFNRRYIGAMIENPILNLNMTGAENLEILRTLFGITDKKIVVNILEKMNLFDRRNIKVKYYSLGMKQRLGLASALINNPRLLLLDEPLNGLDPSGIKEVRNMLLDLNQKQNVTILISSHYLEQLYLLATDYIIINRGKIIEQLTLNELEEKCNGYIAINTDNVSAAINILKNDICDIKVEKCSDNQINIYKYSGSLQQLSNMLSTEGISINTINSVGLSREEYFINLMEGENHV